jgi:hypothetical protein
MHGIHVVMLDARNRRIAGKVVHYCLPHVELKRLSGVIFGVHGLLGARNGIFDGVKLLLKIVALRHQRKVHIPWNAQLLQRCVQVVQEYVDHNPRKTIPIGARKKINFSHDKKKY